MSGYQSLHDLIAQQIGGFVTPTEITTLTDAIHVWMDEEAEAVKEVKAQVEKKHQQLKKVKAENEQTIMTANMPDIDINNLTGGAQ